MAEQPNDPVHAGHGGGDDRDLDAIVARYLPRLHAYVRLHMNGPLRAREASMDVVQSICREVLEARDNFVYQGEGQLISWLLTTATNKLRERARHLGRQKRDPRREIPADDMDPSAWASLATPSRSAMTQEQIGRLEQALARLPEHYREVIVLARIVELPHSEIARRMQRTESATRNLLGRALTQLTSELDAST